MRATKLMKGRQHRVAIENDKKLKLWRVRWREDGPEQKACFEGTNARRDAHRFADTKRRAVSLSHSQRPRVMKAKASA